MSRISFAFMLLLNWICLEAQTVTKGQFSIPRIIPGYDLGGPSTTYHPFQGNVMYVAFDGNKYAVVMKDSRGGIQGRQLFDFKTNNYYHVSEQSGTWIHWYDTIKPGFSFYRTQNSAFEISYYNLTKDAERVNYKGFSCYKLHMVSKDYGKLTLLATDQIGIPPGLAESYRRKSILDSVVILKAVYETKSRTVEAAMDTFYSEVQNPEWFIADQEGAMTRQELDKIKFRKLIQALEDSSYTKGANLEIGLALYDMGLLDEHDLEYKWKNNEDVDKVYWMNQTKGSSMAYDSLILLWNKAGLLSQALVKKIDQYKLRKWKHSREYFFTMMGLLMFHEMMDDRKNRETIVANMETSYRFKPGAEQVKADFIAGKINITSLFFGVKGMYPVPEFFTTKDKTKVENEILGLLKLVFPQLASKFKVWITGDTKQSLLHVSTTGFSYRNEIYLWYLDSDEEEDKPALPVKDYHFDANLLSDFELILKQIGTDYQNSRIYGIESFNRHLSNRYLENYEEVIHLYPELALFKDQWYVGALDRDIADWTSDIKITQRNQELKVDQADFSSLYLCSPLLEYMPSGLKKKVIDFLEKHQQDLELSDELVQMRKDDLQYALVERNDNLMNYIPGLQLTVDQTAESNLTDVPSDIYFSEVFPRIYKFIRKDYNPVITGLSDDTAELYWKDSTGVVDTIPLNANTTEESILIFLNKKLKRTGYGIYFIPSLGINSKDYYYLSWDQKGELEAILNDRLVGIKY